MADNQDTTMGNESSHESVDSGHDEGVDEEEEEDNDDVPIDGEGNVNYIKLFITLNLLKFLLLTNIHLHR